jgi:hypothetical protein
MVAYSSNWDVLVNMYYLMQVSFEALHLARVFEQVAPLNHFGATITASYTCILSLWLCFYLI